MAYNEELAGKVRTALVHQKTVEEKKMTFTLQLTIKIVL
mgnify:CR=1 FL=1